MAGLKHQCLVSFGPSSDKASIDWLKANTGGVYSALFFDTDTHSICAWHPGADKWVVIGTLGKEK